MDKNAHRRNLPVDLEMRTFYGQLNHIYVVHVPTSHPKIPEAEILLLAEVQACETEVNSANGISYYEKLKGALVVDITCIQCLVGRVQVPREGQQSVWAIIDRSGEEARALCLEEEEENEHDALGSDEE